MKGFKSANFHVNSLVVRRFGVVLQLALITNLAFVFAGRLYRFCLQSDPDTFVRLLGTGTILLLLDST